MYPPVSPILLHFGPFTVRWYGLIMTTAIFLGTLVASRYVARKKQDPGVVWEMLFIVLIPALIGARLYFVFIQSGQTSFYLSHPSEILAIWHGGIHIYGAIIFGAITLLIYFRVRKIPALIYLDGIGMGLLLGQAIGRLGNFINQELYGPGRPPPCPGVCASIHSSASPLTTTCCSIQPACASIPCSSTNCCGT